MEVLVGEASNEQVEGPSIPAGAAHLLPAQPPKNGCSICAADLSGARSFYKRYHVCQQHCTAKVVVIDGRDQRFCQQCGQFHDLHRFDGALRSCREHLARHAERRRLRRARIKEAASTLAASSLPAAAAPSPAPSLKAVTAAAAAVTTTGAAAAPAAAQTTEPSPGQSQQQPSSCVLRSTSEHSNSSCQQRPAHLLQSRAQGFGLMAPQAAPLAEVAVALAQGMSPDLSWFVMPQAPPPPAQQQQQHLGLGHLPQPLSHSGQPGQQPQQQAVLPSSSWAQPWQHLMCTSRAQPFWAPPLPLPPPAPSSAGLQHVLHLLQAFCAAASEQREQQGRQCGVVFEQHQQQSADAGLPHTADRLAIMQAAFLAAAGRQLQVQPADAPLLQLLQQMLQQPSAEGEEQLCQLLHVLQSPAAN